MTETFTSEEWKRRSWEEMDASLRRYQREQQARKEKKRKEFVHFANERKKLRQMVKSRGLLQVLREMGVGSLGLREQYKIACLAADVAKAWPPFVYSETSPETWSKLSKLQRLADCPGATAGERQAALEAIERLSATAHPEPQAATR